MSFVKSSILLVFWLNKTNGTARLPHSSRLGLKFCQSCTDGIKLGTSAFIDVVLVGKNIIDFIPKIFNLFS